MTAVQDERVLTELAEELYSFVPPQYLAVFQQLLGAVEGAREQFERGNTTKAFTLLMSATGVRLNPKVCRGTSKEFVIAQVMGKLPTMYQNDLDPDA